MTDIKSAAHYVGFIDAYSGGIYDNPFEEEREKFPQQRSDYSEGYTDGVMEMLRTSINNSLSKI